MAQGRGVLGRFRSGFQGVPVWLRRAVALAAATLFVLASLAGAIGCSWVKGRSSGAARAPLAEGPGGAICVARQLSIWGTIRPTANARVEGWGAPGEPSLIVYQGRGWNPVLTEGKRVRVVWLDGDKVVGVLAPTVGEGGLVLPSVEVTAAIVLPETQDLRGLGEGDVVVLLQKLPGA